MVSLPNEREARRISDGDLLEIGRGVIRAEAEELGRAADRLGPEIVKAARLVQSCAGRLVVSGLGKSGLIGRKIAATLASLGTPAFFLHATEGSHGDLGMVRREDVGLFISHSGETREVLELLPFFRRIGAPVIAMTGNLNSRLARNADVVLDAGIRREADPLGLAPTSSTTLQLALGDALSGMVTELRGLCPEDFALFHPGGSLGKKLLLKVEELMGTGERIPIVQDDAAVKRALFEITSKGYGTALVVGQTGSLVGIFTDGDLRRLLEDRGPEGLELPVSDVMTRRPKTIDREKLAAEALALMEHHEISVLAVVEGEIPVGIIHLHDLLKAGVA
jgi:arabinose-5-phosphate isomerase